MLWIKAFHIIFMVTWFAGLFYLPRLFVYHVETSDIKSVQYNTFLRKELIDKYSIENLSVFQPSHVKKLAGKGNANKHYMAKAFQDDVLNDKNLRSTKLWKWVQGKDFSTKIPKPIDDIVDAYFILKALKANN